MIIISIGFTLRLAMLSSIRKTSYIDRLRFHYGEDNGVIETFDLNIKPGEKVGLFDRFETGKSTIDNLLMIFYNVEKGTIEVD